MAKGYQWKYRYNNWWWDDLLNYLNSIKKGLQWIYPKLLNSSYKNSQNCMKQKFPLNWPYALNNSTDFRCETDFQQMALKNFQIKGKKKWKAFQRTFNWVLFPRTSSLPDRIEGCGTVSFVSFSLTWMTLTNCKPLVNSTYKNITSPSVHFVVATPVRPNKNCLLLCLSVSRLVVRLGVSLLLY